MFFVFSSGSRRKAVPTRAACVFWVCPSPPGPRGAEVPGGERGVRTRSLALGGACRPSVPRRPCSYGSGLLRLRHGRWLLG
eukprot:6854865-Pyramimonas_sp.AAC.1